MYTSRSLARALTIAACGVLAVVAITSLGLPDLAQAAPALLMMATAPAAIVAVDPQAAYTAAGDAAFKAALEAGATEEEAAAKARDAAAAAKATAEAAAADAAGKQPEPPAKRERMVKARVLFDGTHGKINSVVTVPASVAREADDLDPNPAAVAYAESLLEG